MRVMRRSHRAFLARIAWTHHVVRCDAVSLVWPTLRPVAWPAVFVFLALCGRTLIGGLPDYARVYDTSVDYYAQIGITNVTLHDGMLCVPSDTQIQDKAQQQDIACAHAQFVARRQSTPLPDECRPGVQAQAVLVLTHLLFHHVVVPPPSRSGQGTNTCRWRRLACGCRCGCPDEAARSTRWPDFSTSATPSVTEPRPRRGASFDQHKLAEREQTLIISLSSCGWCGSADPPLCLLLSSPSPWSRW